MLPNVLPNDFEAFLDADVSQLIGVATYPSDRRVVGAGAERILGEAGTGHIARNNTPSLSICPGINSLIVLATRSGDSSAFPGIREIQANSSAVSTFIVFWRTRANCPHTAACSRSYGLYSPKTLRKASETSPSVA